MVEIVDDPGMRSRWGTQNTKIAACLCAYGYKQCAEQPYIRLAPHSQPERTSTSIWFEDAHPAGVTQAVPQDWEALWHRVTAGLAVYTPEIEDWHGPLQIMRNALDARDYFRKKIVPFPRMEETPEDAFHTEDLTLALCLISRRLHLFRSVGRFTFSARAVGTMFRDYMSDGENCPMQWCKQALLHQERLVREIRKPENTTNLAFHVGDKFAYIPVNCPPRVREPLVKMLMT